MNASENNPAHFLEVAVAAASEAGAIIAAAMDRPKTISYKGEVDLVTETDKKSEAIILERLRSEFPAHAIVAEEGGASGAGASAEYQWYVDPLVGAIYNPVSKEMFTAVRGEGAHRNGVSIHVSIVSKLSQSLLATGFP